jgi:DNA-binding NarL/FixJ family response regulator
VNINCSGESAISIYLLVQTHLVREMLVRILRKRNGCTVVGASQESAEAFEKLAVMPCDVLLLDSMEALRAVGQRAATTECLRRIKVMLFGMEEDPERFLQAVSLGARGYLLNDASSAEMIEAVRGIAQGEAICPPKLCKSLFEYVAKVSLLNSGKTGQCGHPASDLTCRQRQLMAMVAKGMTNKQIATSLQVSPFTVRNHIRRVMVQLQAESRHQAVDVIRTSGLIWSA